MTDPSLSASEDTPRRSRLRRKEALINSLACVLGCLALVVMIATIFRVATSKLWESTQVNPAYIDAVYEDSEKHGWSGKMVEAPSLLTGDSGSAPNAAPREPTKPDPAPEQRAMPSSQPMTAGTTNPDVNGIRDIDSKRSEIEAVIRGFFEAASIDMKLAFSRDSARVRPLMENYYRSHPMTRPRWKNLGWVMTVDEPGYRFGYAQALFDDADPATVVIEETTDGKYRVDWEHSVSYGEIEWSEFLKVRPAEPTLMRVIASKPHVAPNSGAPKDHEILEIKHPAGEGTVYAYFDRNDPKFQPLIQQLQSGNWKDVPLTLRLCYPGTASPAGTAMSARIANIEGKNWVILKGTRS
ncbi:MAG: hypothetical protein HS117_24945 [Verrucomicrobiaceae bacterium]|nr:hypothetical protein [Verrucomicrobiaceae bacterium]